MALSVAALGALPWTPDVADAPVSESIPALAHRIAGESGRTPERTRRLVEWMQKNLEWTWTDYQKRTAAEILERRAGNCADLATVLEALLQGIGVESRWVAEVNLQPRSEQRQADAEQKVRELGPRGSVFGLEHNDHRWLEVRDAASGQWFPADPAVGVVGITDWEAARLAFGKRPSPPVPAVAQTARDMLVPFAVMVLSSRQGVPREDRSGYYLVSQFDRFYGGRLKALPAWDAWVVQVEGLSRAARAAFKGEESLHQQERQMGSLRRTYERLSGEAVALGIAPALLSAATKP
jgi:transglutaminase-like putative cysteine protease